MLYFPILYPAKDADLYFAEAGALWIGPKYTDRGKAERALKRMAAWSRKRELPVDPIMVELSDDETYQSHAVMGQSRAANPRSTTMSQINDAIELYKAAQAEGMCSSPAEKKRIADGALRAAGARATAANRDKIYAACKPKRKPASRKPARKKNPASRQDNPITVKEGATPAEIGKAVMAELPKNVRPIDAVAGLVTSAKLNRADVLKVLPKPPVKTKTAAEKREAARKRIDKQIALIEENCADLSEDSKEALRKSKLKLAYEKIEASEERAKAKAAPKKASKKPTPKRKPAAKKPTPKKTTAASKPAPKRKPAAKPAAKKPTPKPKATVKRKPAAKKPTPKKAEVDQTQAELVASAMNAQMANMMKDPDFLKAVMAAAE